MTCVPVQTHAHDIVFHVIYGGDEVMIIDFIRGGASRLHAITGCQEIEVMLERVMRERGALGMDTLRALFFVVLNVDMPLKEYICAPGDRTLYAVALGLAAGTSAEAMEKRHSYSMVGTKPIERAKARRFMLELGDIIRAWLSNEALSASDLVAKVREEYLVS